MLVFLRRYIIESRAFIKNAARLIKEISDSDTVTIPAWRETMQKEINQLFSSLQNPTLPSAYRLRDVAKKNGFTVHPQVLQRLASLEHITS